MGQTGSVTMKANIHPLLYEFTKWSKVEMDALLLRSQNELSETIALRKFEFNFLIAEGTLIDFYNAKDLFEEIFDTDRNKMIDKFEVLSVICLASNLPSAQKVQFFFDVFNFNGKGYLTESEVKLLMTSVTTGVFKADPDIKLPNPIIIRKLIEIALSYGKAQKGSIRKPELVRYVAEVKDVAQYMEAWRGHAGQVSLPAGEKWRDGFFQCIDASIYPNDIHSLYEGFPPSHFIRWRRVINVGPGSGRNMLFSHTVNILKTVDKKLVYGGLGCLGSGTFKQGLLADRWILNALAIMSARPQTIIALFSATGQEELGRYCLRFFEGAGWRGVFVDDRVPCGPDCNPIFLTSSDSCEIWPLLVEKALAKYFSTYGHIGRASTRPDSVFAALRILTGGHVIKYCTEDFDWKSVDSECIKEDGFKLVKKVWEEGSLVAFGRSETRLMHRSTLQYSPRKCPPHGHFFPVVGTEHVDAYAFIILHDPWGLIENCEFQGTDPDPVTGRCRIFRIPVENILENYDTLVLCRFPDSLRIQAENMNLVPWKTELLCKKTKSMKNPARFILKIGDAAGNAARQKKLVGAAAVKAKHLEEEKNKKNVLDRVNLKKAIEQTHEEFLSSRVDITFTAASSVDWIVASSPQADAKIRLRIVPTSRTYDRLVIATNMEEERKRVLARKLAIQKIEEARARAKEGYEDERNEEDEERGKDEEDIFEGKEENMEEDDNLPKDGSNQRVKKYTVIGVSNIAQVQKIKNIDAVGTITEEDDDFEEEDGFEEDDSPDVNQPAMGRFLKRKSTRIKNKSKNFDIVLSGEKSWISGTQNMWSGEYFIYTDVSYGMTPGELADMSKHMHPSEAVWRDDDDISVLKMWLAISSIGDFEVCPVQTKLCPKANRSVTSVVVGPDKWPFMMENQGEACTRNLMIKLGKLRDEALLLGSHLIAVSKQYKTCKKNFLEVYEYESDILNQKKIMAEERAKRRAEAEARKKAKEEAESKKTFRVKPSTPKGDDSVRKKKKKKSKKAKKTKKKGDISTEDDLTTDDDAKVTEGEGGEEEEDDDDDDDAKVIEGEGEDGDKDDNERDDTKDTKTDHTNNTNENNNDDDDTKVIEEEGEDDDKDDNERDDTKGTKTDHTNNTIENNQKTKTTLNVITDYHSDNDDEIENEK